jgi:hypothetical protein
LPHRINHGKFDHVPSTAGSPTEQARQGGGSVATQPGRPAVGVGTQPEGPPTLLRAVELSPEGGLHGMPRRRRRPPRAAAAAADHTTPTPTASASAVQLARTDATELASHGRSAAELALQAQMRKVGDKSTPYASNNGEANKNFNGLVSIPRSAPPSQDAGGLVECRHFSTVFAQHPGKKVGLVRELQSQEAVEKAFAGRLSEVHHTHERWLREASPDCKHVVSSENFGQYLAALAHTLKAAPDGQHTPNEANCLVVTTDHSLALYMERKSKAGLDYFAAKVYDPNDTASFKRVEALTPEALQSLTLQQMLKPGAFEYYAGGANKPLWTAVASLDARLKPQMNNSAATSPSVERMAVTLSSGAFNELTAMRQSLPGKQLVQLLLATASGPEPYFSVTLQRGHTETAKAFIEIVLQSDLGNSEKVGLLAAQRRDGAPGLAMALQRGHGDTVKAFAEDVLSSDLDNPSKTELLAARRIDGVPGLYVAFQEGHTEAVTGFSESVLNSTLSDAEKVKLLTARTDRGVPGLLMAFAEGRTETVKGFAEVVLNSNIDNKLKVQLLAARSSDGMFGLYGADQMRHKQTVSAYVGAILSSGLDKQDKNNLLATIKNKDHPSFLPPA